MIMDVSIIIVNYNTCKLIKACISSIYKHTFDVEFEVIVVDNASTDGSIEMLSQDRRIAFIKSETNLGFGKANNLGYQHAKGKYLFLLNSDTVLENNAIKLFFDAAENEVDRRIGCWGTMLRDVSGEIGMSYGHFLSMWKDLYIQYVLLPYSFVKHEKLTDHSYNYPTPDDGTVDYITGADLFMKKEVADRYGLFDPEFFLYCEETDMQKRYSTYGIKSKIIQTPHIIHLQGGSQNTSGKRSKLGLIVLKSKMRYFSRWNNPVFVNLYRILITIIKIPVLIFSSSNMEYKKKYLKIIWSKQLKKERI